MPSVKRFFALVLVSFALQGCGAGGSDQAPDQAGVGTAEADIPPAAAFACSYLGGGAATVENGCVNCAQDAIADPANAIDMDLSTATVLSTYHPDDVLNATATVLTLTAKAQSGVVFPAMSRPGVAIRTPAGYSDYYVTVNTFLAGHLQGSHWEVPQQHSSGEFAYFGFRSGTTKPFDEVQFVINENRPNVEEHVYKVFEFCADGALR
jgi:hypothetical protein